MAKHYHTHVEQKVMPNYPQEVHHHHAPTEDTVKLLQEMEETARKRVLDGYVFESAVLNGIVALMKLSANDFTTIVYVAFNLNGHKYEMNIPFDLARATFDRESAAKSLFEAITEAVSATLMPEVAKALDRRIR